MNVRYTLLSIALLVCSHALWAQPQSLLQHKALFDQELKEWTASFGHFNLSDFYLADSIPFEQPVNEPVDLSTFYELYRPLLAFAPDKGSFVDIYSYRLNLETKEGNIVAHPGRDQAIYLCDLQARTRERIFFTADERRLTDVVWLNNNTFLLVGIQREEGSGYAPIMLMGNTATKTFAFFLNRNPECREQIKYKARKLVQADISGLD